MFSIPDRRAVMEFVHKCPPRRHAPQLSHRIALLQLGLLSASAQASRTSLQNTRYNLISRCLDIVKAELARAAVVCCSQVTLPRLALSSRTIELCERSCRRAAR